MQPDSYCSSKSSSSLPSSLIPTQTSLDLLSASAMDVASFKSDVLNCLDLCSSYIQALNTVCSTGAVLAQTLTQLFSREVIAGSSSSSPFNTLTQSTSSGQRLSQTNSSNKSTLGRRNILGFKQHSDKNNKDNNDSEQSNASQFDLLMDNDLDSDLYYDMTEQFLRSWEVLSVSTAGASATIKTETLMSLQEVINQLESEENESPSNDSHEQLAKSIDAAKACLLSYIELQAQFSRSSWKSLNHLSKALKSDQSMTDPVKKIKKHFDSKKKLRNNNDNNESNLQPLSSPQDVNVGQQLEHQSLKGASSSDESVVLSRSSSKGRKSKNSLAIKHVSGLKEAMELLSLGEDDVRTGTDNKKQSKEDKTSDNSEKRKQVLDALNRKTDRKTPVGHPPPPGLQERRQTVDQSRQKTLLSNPFADQMSAFKTQATSTWPVKGPVSPTVSSFTPHSGTLGHKMSLSPDSWSPWSWNPGPSFGGHSAVGTIGSASSHPWLHSNHHHQLGMTSGIPWKTFPSIPGSESTSSPSASSSSSGSGSCSNNSISLGRSFDPLSQILEGGNLFELNFLPSAKLCEESNNNNSASEG